MKKSFVASNDLIDKVLQLESVTATLGNVHFVFDRLHQKDSGHDLIKMASNLSMGTLQFGPRDKAQINPQSVKVQPLGAKASVQFSEESCIHAGEVIKMKVTFDIEGRGFTSVSGSKLSTCLSDIFICRPETLLSTRALIFGM